MMHDDLLSAMRQPLMIGLGILIFLFCGFFLWASIAPLDTAAVAPGVVIVDTYPKDIQHFEGGIVKKMYVQEGSMVMKGEPLIELDQTQSGTRATLLADHYFLLLALEARLISERDNKTAIAFPVALLDEGKLDADIAEIIENQRREYISRTMQLEGVTNILVQRIEQLKKQISSLQSQVTSSDTQLVLINKEIDSVQQLVDQKYASNADLFRLQREAARLQGDRDERLALVAQADQRIGETNLQIIQNQTESHTDILKELRDTQEKLAEVEEQMRSANDVLARTVITAPRAGKVLNLKVHTIGGVIRPGDTIMTIVPKQDKLVIEARLNPLDIDILKVGMPVKVVLTAFKMRTTPTLTGKIIAIAGDALENPKTQQYYYLSRIELDSDQLDTARQLHLYPGMPVQIMVIVNTDSMLNYLLAPLTSSLGNAFKEE